MEIEFKGTKFFVTQGVTHPAYSIFTFTDEEADFRNQHWDIKEGDVVIDVGCSYGAYALTACALGATVYCFEPEKTVYDDLIKNIRLNDWVSRCTAYNSALWDKPARIDMKEYAPHWPQQTITSTYPADSLDNVMSSHNLTKVNWLKIDVEGVEEKVITGASNIIKQFKPNLLVECHDFMDPEISNRVKNMLEGLADYDVQVIPRDPCVILVAKVKI